VNTGSQLSVEVDCPHSGGRDYYRVISKGTYPPGIDRAALVEMYSASSAHALMGQLIECQSCRLVHLNPRVSEDVITEGYSSAVDSTFVAQDARHAPSFRRAFDRLNVKRPVPASETTLDVGCAGGALPKAVSGSGCRVVDVEQSNWLADHGRNQYGLDIRQGILSDQDFGEQTFDLVTLWDVIEHLTDADQVVGDIRELLNPGGLLVVNCPDHGGIVARAMGWRWPFLLSAHLLYFTRRTIRAFLEARGFDMLKIRPYFQTLQLGYVVERGEPYAHLRVGPLRATASASGLWRVPFMYNMARSFLVARKRA
jgi:2-polyprenyl-3-methyl-5-hydroxy-6-metoxy-1,4-benzoquinol methylase